MSFLFSSNTVDDSIHKLLNVEDEEEKDELTDRWKRNKLQELNFVGIVGGLLANVLTSTNSWPDVLQSGKRTPWSVRACWFSGLVFALASVLTAASQSIRLYRLSGRSDANASIRALLSSRTPGRNGEALPNRYYVYLWQSSVLYLNCSVIILIAGLFVLLWSAAGGESWWSGQAQLAITFTVVASVVGLLVILEQWMLFSADVTPKSPAGNLRL